MLLLLPTVPLRIVVCLLATIAVALINSAAVYGW